MNKFLIVAALLTMTSVAHAQYDTSNKNIMNDVDTITAGDIAANDYMKVFSVSNTTTGYGEAEKIRLSAVAPYVANLTATNTLTSADCGKTLMLNHATEFVTTLPSPASGCWFKFFVKNAPEVAHYTVVTASAANVIIGGVNELETDTGDDGPYIADGDTITFVSGTSVVGDEVEMISDGTSWYINGQAKADGGITLTSS